MKNNREKIMITIPQLFCKQEKILVLRLVNLMVDILIRKKIDERINILINIDIYFMLND